MNRTCLSNSVQDANPAPYRGARKTAPVLLGVLIGGLLGLLGCAGPRARVANVAEPPEIVSSPTRFRKEYILAPGDQIEVVVWRVPEVSRTLMIRPDGYVSLPML